jgi:glutathione synthase/RimK-type ligase-like ATP-grasp enzyme
VILLWGLSGDGPFESICAALHRRGARVAVVDQRMVLRTSAELEFGGRLRGTIRVDEQVVPLEDVSAVYWRTYDVRRLPAVLAADNGGANGAAMNAAWALEEALVVWLEMTTARVVNRPSNMANNGSKPYQLALLRAHGFDVPKTLITTDPEAVRRFWTDCASVVYKSISGTRSIVSRLRESHLDRLDNVVWCPTQFQQFVPGRDHRVHVVGDDVFACEVCSDADDYRYAGLHGEPARLREVRLPVDIEERCVTVTRSLGLHLAGIDLRRAPDGRWFCFEVNPSPGFTYYEAHTGQPVADAIASLLASATSGERSADPVPTVNSTRCSD